MLETRNLSAAYDRPVLTGVNIKIAKGSRVALLGANGSGKTTLLRCLSGAHKPKSGQVYLDGQAVSYDRSGLRGHRQKVQLVLQDPDDQLFSADVTQDVAFGPLNLGMSEDEAVTRVNEVLEMIGITHLANRPTHQLSYGERKRVTIAGAVAMSPQVLLLDEPTAGLDPLGVEEIRATLQRLTEAGTTIVLATHEVDFALSWADEAVIVCEGQTTQGPIVELLKDANLVTQAHLLRPWQLELSTRLGLPGSPTTMTEVVDQIEAWR